MEEIKKKISELNEKIDTLQQHISDIEDLLVDIYGIANLINEKKGGEPYKKRFNRIMESRKNNVQKPIVQLPKVPLIIKYHNIETIKITKVDYELNFKYDENKWFLFLELDGECIKEIKDTIMWSLEFNVYKKDKGKESLAFKKGPSFDFNIFANITKVGETITRRGKICILEPGDDVRLEIIDNIDPIDSTVLENTNELKENEVENQQKANIKDASRIRLRNMAQEWNDK